MYIVEIPLNAIIAELTATHTENGWMDGIETYVASGNFSG